MPDRLVIIGCGGFGREVFGIVQALSERDGRWSVEGFVDDAPTREDLERIDGLGARLIGTVDVLKAANRSADPLHAVVAIGSSEARSRVVERLEGSGLRWATLVHPDATIGPATTLGDGTVVAPGARLSTNIRVGAHVHIDQNVTVGHDTVVGEFARLNPMACISGSVTIGRGALIGANATVLPGLTVGPRAVLGASGCATRDIPADLVVKGVPARWSENDGHRRTSAETAVPPRQ